MNFSTHYSYLRRYGISGGSRFFLIKIFSKLFKLKVFELKYYRRVLEEADLYYKDLEFREIDYNDFEEASGSAIHNKWFHKNKLIKIKNALDSNVNRCYGHYKGKELVCYGFLKTNIAGEKIGNFCFSESDVYLWDDYVAPQFRGKGYHGKLIQFRLSKARAMGKKRAWCSIYPYNKASYKNYVNQGFKPIFQFTALKLKNGKVYKWIKDSKG